MPTATRCSTLALGDSEGGDTGWLKDNLKESEEKPEFHGVTALWTFDKKWDPEQRIRDLWDVLAY